MYELFLLAPAQKDLDKLEAPVFARIVKKIRALFGDARPPGCLKLTGEDGYRIRIGEYRVLYRVDDPLKRIFVYRIKHRKDVYY
ncbi:MAG: type II toxin-antitoxin system RelE/ParE family toxin [Candidatus Aminicenantes bacterium]|nr:type II toxin-antitoxin system RelE/ParE family toxin [Candidatus Aminicenantes bacterium]